MGTTNNGLHYPEAGDLVRDYPAVQRASQEAIDARISELDEGLQPVRAATDAREGGTLVKRRSDGGSNHQSLWVAEVPKNTGSVTHKGYVDDADAATLAAAKDHANDETSKLPTHDYVQDRDAATLDSSNLYTDTTIQSRLQGRLITPEESLDNLAAPSDYYVPADTDATPDQGFPVSRAGRLITTPFNHSGTHRVQIYYPFRHPGIFLRYIYSDSPYVGTPYQGMPGGWQEFRNWSETLDAINESATQAPVRTDPTQWAAVGDSLTDGYSSGARWDEADSYPAKLQAVLPPGTTVTNYGQSGATSDQINLLLGLVPYRVRIPSGAIPSSGTVTVETDQAIGGWSDTQDLSFAGHLVGVHGRLERTSGAWSFTRADSGTPVTATHATFRGHNGAMPTLDGISGHSLIVGYGRNDMAKNVRGMETTIPDHVIRSYVDAYESMTAQHRQIVMLGTITRPDETPDSDGFRMVQEIGTRLRALFPTHFLDLQGYLTGTAVWDDTGLTPTEADLDAQAQGMTPPQLFDDVTHYSRITAQAIAHQLIAPHIKQKGWV